MTDAERAEFERKGFEEQKIKETMNEIMPEWQFYCDIRGDHKLLTKSFWLGLIQDKLKQEVGEE